MLRQPIGQPNSGEILSPPKQVLGRFQVDWVRPPNR